MEKQKIEKLNLRVYGLILNQKGELLLSDEFRMGTRMTKFPGGGLKPGEGTIDCLRRECREELQQEIHSIRHFYTTDFFQPTFLLPEPQQLISIYYLVHAEHPQDIKTTNKIFDFEDIEGAQAFRWATPETITTSHLTFPIDKIVLNMLKEKLADETIKFQAV